MLLVNDGNEALILCLDVQRMLGVHGQRACRVKAHYKAVRVPLGPLFGERLAAGDGDDAWDILNSVHELVDALASVGVTDPFLDLPCQA